MKKTDTSSGFTLVELAIVIIVVGILASILIVGYRGTQERGRDSVRKQHVAQISEALSLYKLRKGNLIEEGSGCGQSGNGYGWFNYGGGGTPTMSADANYSKSIASCLSEAGYLTEQIKDPSGVVAYHEVDQAGRQTYMKYNCIENDKTVAYVFAKLEKPNSPNAVQNSSICAFAKERATAYGMNYFSKVE